MNEQYNETIYIYILELTEVVVLWYIWCVLQQVSLSLTLLYTLRSFGLLATNDKRLHLI